MATQYFASDYAYGINPDVENMVVQSGSNAAGVSGTVNVNKSTLPLAFGRTISPFNTNASINIDGDTAVAVSAISIDYVTGLTSLTLTTPTHAHGKGSIISSGTVGLQEALNDAASRTNGGVVIVDARWTTLGGTNAMVAAATIPTGCYILDLRTVGSNSPVTLLAADGAIPIRSGYYVITKTGSAAALTLAAPTAAQAGTELIITSRTAFTHQITATGLLCNGGAAAPYNTATGANAKIGASITLSADNLVWNVLSVVNMTIA